MSNHQTEEFNESVMEAANEVCEHDWDIEDYTHSGGGDAWEVCMKCGIKNGR